jgi:hypothetical protein
LSKKPPGQDGNLVASQTGSNQDRKQVDDCGASGKKDPFSLNLATKPGPYDPLLGNEKLPPAIQVDANHNRVLATRIGVGV